MTRFFVANAGASFPYQRKYYALIALLYLWANPTNLCAQATKQQLAFVVDDFFFTRDTSQLSDLHYAAALAGVVRDAKTARIPLHITLPPLSAENAPDYIADALLPYLAATPHTCSHATALLATFAPTLPDSLTDLWEKVASDTEKRLLAQNYADTLWQDIQRQATHLNRVVGTDFPHIVRLRMHALTAHALPFLWEKIQQAHWQPVPYSEAAAHPLYHIPRTLPDSLLAEALRAPFSPPTLAQFLHPPLLLEWRTEYIFSQLTDAQRVGQMFVVAAGVLGKPDREVEQRVADHELGGVLLLKGSVPDFQKRVRRLDSLAQRAGTLPLLYSADAEPSLLGRKISGTPKVPNTNKLRTTEAADTVARQIASTLRSLSILHNYAPVADLSPRNEAIGNRSFGDSLAQVAALCRAFIEATQAQGVVATAKHFPGHGFVQGDSHLLLPQIKGELKELGVYPPLIAAGVISIMVGHIAVTKSLEYDTEGLPASCSRKVVTGLLKEKLGFQSLVITDALGMGGVRSVPNAPFKAAQAGCDLLLMAPNEPATIAQLLAEMETDEAFRAQIYTSVKKIIRLKLCAGLLQASPVFLPLSGSRH